MTFCHVCPSNQNFSTTDHFILAVCTRKAVVKTSSSCVCHLRDCSWVHGRPHIGANGVSYPPGKMDEKLKSKNMQKRAVFYVYVIFWEQSEQADVENGVMLTTYLFRYTSECIISLSNFQKEFSPRAARGHWPPNEILRTFLRGSLLYNHSLLLISWLIRLTNCGRPRTSDALTARVKIFCAAIVGIRKFSKSSGSSHQRWQWVSGSRVTGHGLSGSTNLSGSRGSRVSTRDPLTHDQVNKIPRTGYFVAVMMFDFESTST